MKQKLIDKFDVSETKINYYRNKVFKYLGNINTENCKYKQIVNIDVNKIVGTTRVDINADTFDEFINTFHKEYLLNKNNENLSEIIANSNNGYPEIYFCNGEYYLCGEGKHRIIIALLSETNDTCYTV